MRKRGFTLIELLAVILILGIIALIAIPIVNNIIRESRRGAFETTANNVVSAVEEACQLQNLKNEALTTTYTFVSGTVLPSLNIKGKLPSSGSAVVDANCNVTLDVTNGTYTAKKLASEEYVTVTDGVDVEEPPTSYSVYANGTAVYFNPVTGAKCTSGEAVSTTGTKTGCMKWYTFNDGGTEAENINLILDHNTTAVVAWNSTGSNVSGPTNVLTQLQTDTSAWAGVTTRSDNYSVNNGTSTYTINYSTYKARLITAAEVATITSNSSFVEATTPYTGWYYFDSNNQTQTITTPGASSYDWLFDYTSGCTSYGCNTADASNLGYWTSTAVPALTGAAWFVDSNSCLRNYNAPGTAFGSVDGATHRGVRPVITIPKSKLS